MQAATAGPTPEQGGPTSEPRWSPSSARVRLGRWTERHPIRFCGVLLAVVSVAIAVDNGVFHGHESWWAGLGYAVSVGGAMYIGTAVRREQARPKAPPAAPSDAASMPGQPAGWYPHVTYLGQESYWDGEAWTSRRRWAS
jgi:hypothetical protein